MHTTRQTDSSSLVSLLLSAIVSVLYHIIQQFDAVDFLIAPNRPLHSLGSFCSMYRLILWLTNYHHTFAENLLFSYRLMLGCRTLCDWLDYNAIQILPNLIHFYYLKK